MVDRGNSRRVSSFLAYLVRKNISKRVPGLYISLNFISYSRYGVEIGELLWKDPAAFAEVFKQYFRDPELSKEVLIYVLKPLSTVDEGLKAIDALMNGEGEEFRRIALKILKNKAKEWFYKETG